jgi:hypothetical protein
VTLKVADCPELTVKEIGWDFIAGGSGANGLGSDKKLSYFISNEIVKSSFPS